MIFTADNGFLHGEHGLSGKWFPFEESIRVPLVIWDPRMPAGKRRTLDDSITLNIDLAPTVLAAARIKPPVGMQGRNIAELYLNASAKQNWRTQFYYEHPMHGHGIPASSALVRKNFKYVKYDQMGVESLFDLTTDPHEEKDVVGDLAYADRLAEMKHYYEELRLEVAKPPPYTGVTV